MKKYLVGIVSLCVFVSFVWAGGPPGTTFTVVLDNTSRSMETLATAAGASYEDSTRGKPKGAWISVRTYDAKWASKTNPVAGTSGLGHVIAVGSSWEITEPETVRNIRWINSSATDNSVLDVTFTY